MDQIQGPCTTCVLRTTRISIALIALATFPSLSFDFWLSYPPEIFSRYWRFHVTSLHIICLQYCKVLTPVTFLMCSLMDLASVKAIPLYAHLLIPNSSPISSVKIRAVFTRVCTCFSSIPYNFKPSINRRWLIRPFLFLISYPSFYLNTTEEWEPQQIAGEGKFCLCILTVWIYYDTVAILVSLYPFSTDPFFFPKAWPYSLLLQTFATFECGIISNGFLQSAHARKEGRKSVSRRKRPSLDCWRKSVSLILFNSWVRASVPRVIAGTGICKWVTRSLVIDALRD